MAESACEAKEGSRMPRTGHRFVCAFCGSRVCPHCGFEHSDSWEISGDWHDCHDCERSFEVQRYVTTRYSTFKE